MRTWVCGTRLLPMKIAGDPPKRLTGVFWLCEGAVVGGEVFEDPQISDAALLASFEKAVAEPARGAPSGRPTKVRVETAALAERLRPLLRGVKIEIGPTPEFDEFLGALAQGLSQPALDDVERVLETPAEWHDDLRGVARELLAAEPWEVVPPGPALQIHVPALDVPDGRITVMGHLRETYGLMLFFSPDDLATFEMFAQGDSSPERAPMPRCLSLNVEDLAIPGGHAGPVAIVRVFEMQEQRGPSDSELKIAIAAARALARFVEGEHARLEATAEWRRGIEVRYRVPVRGAEIEIVIAARLPGKTPRTTRARARRR